MKNSRNVLITIKNISDDFNEHTLFFSAVGEIKLVDCMNFKKYTFKIKKYLELCGVE